MRTFFVILWAICVNTTALAHLRDGIPAPPKPIGSTEVCTQTIEEYRSVLPSSPRGIWQVGGANSILGFSGNRVQVRWESAGTWPLWVELRDGADVWRSDTLWITVTEDIGSLTLANVTRPNPEGKEIKVEVLATGFPENALITVERRVPIGGWFRQIDLPLTFTAYTYTPFEPDEIYQYRLQATTACGQVLQTSAQQPIALTLEKEDSTALLSWTPYIGWLTGVEEYMIYRKLAQDSVYRAFASVPGSETSYWYDDSRVALGHTFYVEARGIGEQQRSKSDTAFVSFDNPIFFYDAFTPNGDGINDLLEVGNLPLYKPNRIRVYDRTGDRVLLIDDYQNDWDGGNFPAGVYYLYVETIFGAQRSIINLIR